MRLKLISLLLLTVLFSCEKSEVKKNDDQNPSPKVTTDFRESYKGNFSIKTHRTGSHASYPGQGTDTTTTDTISITYSLNDSITFPVTNIRVPALKFTYRNADPIYGYGDSIMVGIDSSKRLYINYTPGNNNGGGFISADSIYHVQWFYGRYSYIITTTGYRIK